MHPTITGATTLAGKRAAARAIVDPIAGDRRSRPTPPTSCSAPAPGPTPARGVTDHRRRRHRPVGRRSRRGHEPVRRPARHERSTTSSRRTLENLQDGDRLYYLQPYAGHEPAHPARGQLVRRDDPAQHRRDEHAEGRRVRHRRLQVPARPTPRRHAPRASPPAGSTVADDPSTTDCDENKLLLRKPDGTIQYRAINSVDPSGINGQSVYNGTAGVDRIVRRQRQRHVLGWRRQRRHRGQRRRRHRARRRRQRHRHRPRAVPTSSRAAPATTPSTEASATTSSWVATARTS